MLQWLKDNRKPVSLVAALIALASAIYLLLKYASAIAASVYAALVVQLAIGVLIVILHSLVARNRNQVDSEQAALAGEHSTDSGVVVDHPADLSLAALTLAVRLFATVAFVTTILTIGISAEKPFSIQQAVTAGVWLPFAGALVAEIEFLPALRDGRLPIDLFQSCARMAVGSAITGVGAAILSLAVSSEYAILHTPAGGTFWTVFTRLIAGRANSTETVLVLVMVGAVICSLGLALIRGVGRNMFVLSWATCSALVGLGFATWLAAGGYGLAEIVVGIAIGLLGTFLHRGLWLAALVVVFLVVPSANIVAFYAFLHQQVEITVSSAIVCLAALAFAVGLYWRAGVLEFDPALNARSHRFPKFRRRVWKASLYILLPIIAAGGVAGSILDYVDHRPGTAWGFAGAAIALVIVVVLFRHSPTGRVQQDAEAAK